MGNTVVYMVLFFVGTIFVGIIGFGLTLKFKGTRDPNALWVHEDELAEREVAQSTVQQVFVEGKGV